jgi:hypothetical protein
MQPIIDDFSVGEVSRLAEAKLSSAIFRNGLLEASNIIPDSHGPLMGRPGFQFMGNIALDDPSYSATLYVINYSPDVYFLVVLTHYKVRVYEPIETAGIPGVQQIYTATTALSEWDLHGTSGNHDETLSQAVISPDGLTLVVLTGNRRPQGLFLSYTVTPGGSGTPDDYAWTFEWKDIPFVNPPSEWAQHTWPTTMCFFQGRSWWAGCRDNPDWFYSSVSAATADDFWDMTTASEPPVDTDGIRFQIAQHGQIRWLKGARNLLIGTELGEFIATADANVLVPSDIQVDMQSAFGSRRIMAELLGNEVVYVTSDGRKLRSMWYKWVESGWVSLDATYNSEHLTRPVVRDIAYMRNPYSMLWVVLKNGDAVVCTYRREASKDEASLDQGATVGWHRLVNDEITVESVASVEADGTSETWALIKEARDNDKFSICRSVPRDYEDEAVCLDVYRTALNSDRIWVGATYADGSKLDAIVDGFHVKDIPVTGDYAYPGFDFDVAYVGHPYTQKVETMPLIDPGGAEKGGVTFHMKRWNRVFLRLVNSYLPLVDGHRPAERNPTTNDNVAEPTIFDGFVAVAPGFGWDRDGKLEITQDRPFRLILTGIYGQIAADTI